MAIRLAEIEPRDYIYVCTPTGDELPEMINHWNRIGQILGSRILPVTSGHSLQGLIRGYNALPNWRQRWCTRQLKIEPFKAFLVNNLPATSYVGLRADEEDRVGGIYNDIDEIKQRYPMREWGWGLIDVLNFLHEKGIKIPARTDCARCFYQTLGEWWNLWKLNPDEYADAEAQEKTVGHTFRSPGRDSWPASLLELRQEFDRGRVPRGSDIQPDLFKERRCRVCSL